MPGLVANHNDAAVRDDAKPGLVVLRNDSAVGDDADDDVADAVTGACSDGADGAVVIDISIPPGVGVGVGVSGMCNGDGKSAVCSGRVGTGTTMVDEVKNSNLRYYA